MGLTSAVVGSSEVSVGYPTFFFMVLHFHSTLMTYLQVLPLHITVLYWCVAENMPAESAGCIPY